MFLLFRLAFEAIRPSFLTFLVWLSRMSFRSTAWHRVFHSLFHGLHIWRYGLAYFSPQSLDFVPDFISIYPYCLGHVFSCFLDDISGSHWAISYRAFAFLSHSNDTLILYSAMWPWIFLFIPKIILLHYIQVFPLERFISLIHGR